MMMRNKQQGFSLFMVMIIMLVIALLVVVTNQSSSTESRMGANDADRKYALSMAESGLRDAETRIQGFVSATPPTVFDSNCANGLCTPVEPVNITTTTSPMFSLSGHNPTVAWERPNVWDGSQLSTAGSNPKVRYIIEYLGERTSGGRPAHLFRVTSKAQGQNANTVVTLQSYVEMIP